MTPDAWPGAFCGPIVARSPDPPPDPRTCGKLYKKVEKTY